MSDINSPDNDNIRRQQERDLGHKLDHAGDKKHGPPAELLKPTPVQGSRRYLKTPKSEKNDAE